MTCDEVRYNKIRRDMTGREERTLDEIRLDYMRGTIGQQNVGDQDMYKKHRTG